MSVETASMVVVATATIVAIHFVVIMSLSFRWCIFLIIVAIVLMTRHVVIFIVLRVVVLLIQMFLRASLLELRIVLVARFEIFLLA